MKLRYLIAVALIVGISLTSRAHDIDIYVDPENSSTNAPVVIFSIDYEPSLSGAVCGGSPGDCSPAIEALYDAAEIAAGNPLGSFLNKDPAVDTISKFDLLRAVLKKVFYNLNGVKVGFVMAHNDTCNSNNADPTKVTGQGKCSYGGYVMHAAEMFQTTITAGVITDHDPNGRKQALADKLDYFGTPKGNQSHKHQGKAQAFEVFRYLSSQGVHGGKKGWEDFDKNESTLNLDDAGDIGYPVRWDIAALTNATSSTYKSPIETTANCTKSYWVNIMLDQFAPGKGTAYDADINASGGSGGMPGIALTDFNSVLDWLHGNDVAPHVDGVQSLTSYFVMGKINNTTRGYAGAGQGLSSAEPYALYSDPGCNSNCSVDPDKLTEVFNEIFRNILSTSTTFVAPTVAVNVYNRAQVREEIFVAMFQAPDPILPGWPGNLKRYKIGKNAAKELEIQDVSGGNAVAADGRIDYTALSFWTLPDDLPAAPTGVGVITELVTGKDGREVPRGGAGSKIPGYKLVCSPVGTDQSCYPGNNHPGLTNPSAGTDTTQTTNRRLYYENGTGAMAAFEATNAVATEAQTPLGGTSVGTCDETETDPNSACALITYARGVEYWDDDADINTADVPRSRGWIMGDLLHSRPLAINYGARAGYSTTNPDIRIVVGGNDGFLRMIRNTKEGGTVTNQTAEGGVEAWGFMPRDIMDNVKLIRAGSGAADPKIHPYGVDGAITSFILDWNGNGNIELPDADGKYDKVWIFFGLRRGGRTLYGMDISDPDVPSLMWKIVGGSGDYAELGETWSTPQIAMMVHTNDTTSRPNLVFGGGFDTNKDTHGTHTVNNQTHTGSNDSQGNAIFIVDAHTGALVWKAVKGGTTGAISTTASAKVTELVSGATQAIKSTTYEHTDLFDSIPSEIRVVDSDANGLVDRLYVGDTGGVMWRADLRCIEQDNASAGCTNPWRLTKMMSVGRHIHGSTNSDVANDRRFFYPPAYVKAKDASGDFDAILIGSGDRTAPKDTAVENWLYMFRDTNTNSDSVPVGFTTVSDAQLGDVTNNCLQDNTCGGTPPDLSNGWKMQLYCPPEDHTATPPAVCGEKALAEFVVLGGTAFVTTYLPPTSGINSCQLSEGTGYLYALSLYDATAVEDFYAPNNGLGTRDRFDKLRSPGIPAEIVSIGGGDYLRSDFETGNAGLKPGFRTFWYERLVR